MFSFKSEIRKIIHPLRSIQYPQIWLNWRKGSCSGHEDIRNGRKMLGGQRTEEAILPSFDSRCPRLHEISIYTVLQKHGHTFCFCYNFVSCDQILVIFGSLVTKEICNRTLLTNLKEIAGAASLALQDSRRRLKCKYGVVLQYWG